MAWTGFLISFVLGMMFVLMVTSQDCIEYFEEADSMFKQPEVIPKKFENSQIVNLTLIERRSYYRCDPAEEKYGIRLDANEWWVFHGCGGIFEITECSPSGQTLIMKPDVEATLLQENPDKKAETKIATDGTNTQQKLTGF